MSTFKICSVVNWLFQTNDCSKHSTTLVTHSHTHTHTHIHWWQRPPCKVPTAQQDQFGVQFSAGGHFDMQLAEPWISTCDLPVTTQPALPLDLELAYTVVFVVTSSWISDNNWRLQAYLELRNIIIYYQNKYKSCLIITKVITAHY